MPAGLSTFLGASLTVFVEGAGVFGLFAGLAAGLFGGVSVLMGFLLAYGSAVAGLARSALRRGRTGAEDKVPTEALETFRDADVDIAVVDLPIPCWAADFFGDENGSADPGRDGRFFSLAALF